MFLRTLFIILFIFFSSSYNNNSLYAAQMPLLGEHDLLNFYDGEDIVAYWQTSLSSQSDEKSENEEYWKWNTPSDWVKEWHPSRELARLTENKKDTATTCHLTDDYRKPVITDESLIKIFTAQTLLESVTLIDCILITKKAIDFLLENCKNLTELMIVKKSSLNPTYLQKISRSYPDLIVTRK